MRNNTLIRKKRNRAKLKRVNTNKPRLTVFRSTKYIYAQLIDDSKRSTIVSASSKEKALEKQNKTEMSKVVGKLIAERSLEKVLKKFTLIEVVTNITAELNHWQKRQEAED